MPRYLALFIAPFIGSLAGTAFLFALYREVWVVESGVFVLITAYAYTAVVCVPLIYVLPRYRALTPLAAYLAAAAGGIAVALLFAYVLARTDFALCAVIVAGVSAVTFNVVFFRRVAL